MRLFLAVAALLLTLQGANAAFAAEPVPPRAEQKIPYKQTEGSTAGVTLRIVGALVVTILIGIGAVYAIKRFLPSIYRPAVSGGERIHVREVRRLTVKTTLFLVEVHGTSLLLAQSGSAVSLLQQLPAREGDAAHDDRRG